MINWVELITGTIVGGVARFEFDSFLRRKHRARLEASQNMIAHEAHLQTLLLLKLVESVEDIHNDVAKG
jgi:hypothetical protein